MFLATELPDVPNNINETPAKSADKMMNLSVSEQSQSLQLQQIQTLQQRRSDTASFSNMKQKFYYANKILALQRKIAEQVRTSWG